MKLIWIHSEMRSPSMSFRTAVMHTLEETLFHIQKIWVPFGHEQTAVRPTWKEHVKLILVHLRML